MPKDIHPPWMDRLHWEIGSSSDQHYGHLRCLICNDGIWRKERNCRRHAESDKHRKLELFFANHDLKGLDSLENQHSAPRNTLDRFSSPEPSVVGVLGKALQYMNRNVNARVLDSMSYQYGLDMNWDVPSEMYDDIEIGVTLEVPIVDAIISQTSTDVSLWLAEVPVIDSDTYSDAGDAVEDTLENDEYLPDLALLQAIPRLRQSRIWDENTTWFPWPDKTYCIIDILRHFPRSTFSEKQNGMISWAMKALNLPQIHSENGIKTVTESLQYACGVKTIRHQGALGHIYYANDLLALIAQEMSNPHVRPHLHFFPEDTGNILANAYEAKHWLREMDPELLSPVIKQGSQEFYIFEPAVLANQTCCIPVRWFKRSGIMYALVWPMHSVKLWNMRGWVVKEHECFDVPAHNFLVSFPYLMKTFQQRNITNPSFLFGLVRKEGEHMRRWTYTNPAKGNKWHYISRGHPVYAFPIWLYCDDTSGNSSKKWNKHNSFLFVPAGLPHKHVHLEYNVHFISTSNLADPLEMLEGIVDQLNYAQEHGIWAWDYLANEMVLLIPSVLALLGDNPMQSEFASHIGLNGNRFCRICLVSNPTTATDNANAQCNVSTQNEAPNEATGADTNRNNEVLDINSSGAEIVAENNIHCNGERVEGPNQAIIDGAGIETAPDRADIDFDPSRNLETSTGDRSAEKGKGRKKPSVAQLISRTTNFLTIGDLRVKDQTAHDLQGIFILAATIRGMTQAKKLKTLNGLKDKYQEHFIEQIAKFTQTLSSGTISDKQIKLNEFVHKLPANPMNPVWKIRGLDAHSDTPVEILHVVLLGFVKYFWRDVMARLNAENKALLVIRLSSIDTSGLGFPPLSGKTLVQYSGSLTGRDFRAIAQVAPFVLYDLLAEEIFQAWLALSSLLPLIWQPVIYNLESHISKIQNAINCFLDLTARWTPRWFNKPKFHILLHLVEHIRRFGPPSLFATETFESYNALIRDLSVHSNRQAPSRDIGRGFANANRVRHLTSGGKFYMGPLTSVKPSTEKSTGGDNDAVAGGWSSKEYKEFISESFRTIGPDVKALIKGDVHLQKFLGFPGRPQTNPNALERDQIGIRTWKETRASQYISPDIRNGSKLMSLKYFSYISCSLENGDTCSLGSWVIGNNGGPQNQILYIAKVLEILQISGSSSELSRQPDLLLLLIYSSNLTAEKYQVPKLIETDNYILAKFSSVVCGANIQHNCMDHKCKVSRTRKVQQEREVVTQLGLAVKHENPEDIVLNCYKMRDFCYIQQFCLQPTSTDRQSMIKEGAEREINARRTKETQPRGTTAASRTLAESDINGEGSTRISNVPNNEEQGTLRGSQGRGGRSRVARGSRSTRAARGTKRSRGTTNSAATTEDSRTVEQYTT